MKKHKLTLRIIQLFAALLLSFSRSLLEAQPVYTNFTFLLGTPGLVPDANPGIPTYPYTPDGHVSFLLDNGTNNVYQMYWAGESSYRSLGANVSVQSLNPGTALIGPGASTNDYDNGGAWLMSVSRISQNELMGFYHAEDWNWPGYNNTNEIAWKSMALCTSADNGETWSKVGQIITSNTPKPSKPDWGGAGDGCVVYDQANARWVCFYSDNWIQIAVSTNAIPLPGTWKKYYNGSFSTSGLGGRETPVPGLSSVPGANPSVHFNTYLQRWIIIWEAWDGSGLYLSTSADLLGWTAPVLLVPSTPPEQVRYATIIGSSDVEASRDAMLYYAYWSDVDTDIFRQFVARTIHFDLAVTQPQKIIPILTAPAWTAVIQSPQIIDNGINTTVPAQPLYSITAKTLLTVIAQDEFREGNYGSSNFPAGSQLVLLADPASFADSYYVVENQAGQVLVNVSDLMSLQAAGNFTVYSYVENDVTGLNNPMTSDYIGTIFFDDTGAGGTMKFNLSRLVETTSMDKMTSQGIYTETVSSKVGVGNGTGNIAGNNALIYSATATEAGKVSFSFP